MEGPAVEGAVTQSAAEQLAAAKAAVEGAPTGGRAKKEAAERQAAKKARRRGKLRGWATIILFALPALLLFVVLVLVPIGVAVYTSLFRWNGYGGMPTDFVGLHNYRMLLDDEVFTGDLIHGGILIVLSLLVQLPLALGLAMLLNQRIRGRAVYRLLFFAPYVLSEVITAVLFLLVFSPNAGMVNAALEAIGITNPPAWFGDPATALYAVFIVITWKYFGLHMILYLAGRQGIPNELSEAAAVDGAGSWQAFRHITLPLLGPTIRISIFLSVIGTIQLFDLPWVLTAGGPVHSSETMAITMFQYGFRRDEIGYASAISVAMFLISFVFAIFYQRFVMRRDVEGAITTMRDQR